MALKIEKGLTPYQRFITQDLRGVPHTQLTTKAAWNAALDHLRAHVEHMMREGCADETGQYGQLDGKRPANLDDVLNSIDHRKEA